MKCGYCHEEGVDVAHVRSHLGERQSPLTRAEKQDIHHDARRALFEEIRAASERVEPGWYAVLVGSVMTTFEVYTDDRQRTRIRLSNGSPVPEGLHGELLAYRKIGRNPQLAMLEYGIRTGNCGHCNENLPNIAARARGMSPICADDMGWMDFIQAG